MVTTKVYCLCLIPWTKLYYHLKSLRYFITMIKRTKALLRLAFTALDMNMRSCLRIFITQHCLMHKKIRRIDCEFKPLPIIIKPFNVYIFLITNIDIKLFFILKTFDLQMGSAKSLTKTYKNIIRCSFNKFLGKMWHRIIVQQILSSLRLLQLIAAIFLSRLKKWLDATKMSGENSFILHPLI